MQKKLFSLLFTGISVAAMAQTTAPDPFAASITKEDLKKTTQHYCGAPKWKAAKPAPRASAKPLLILLPSLKHLGLHLHPVPIITSNIIPLVTIPCLNRNW